MPFALYLLALAVFVMGTSEFMLAGLLPAVAADLQVTVPTAGLLTSAFAAGMVVGAPLTAVFSRAWPPRSTLLICLLVFAGCHVLGALTPSFAVLFLARVASAVANAGFLAVALSAGTASVPAHRTGRALAILLSGTTLAMVAGVPAGALLGTVLGWRATFWVVALLCIPAMSGVFRGIPSEPGHTARGAATTGLRSELSALGSGDLPLAMVLAALVNGATFAAFTYLAPVVTGTAGMPERWVPVALVLFGVGSFCGISIAGRLSDTHPGVVLALGAPAALGGWVALALVSPHPVALLLMVLVQGALSFGVGSTVIARVLRAASGAPTLSGAYATAALNVGAVAGPVLGGIGLRLGPGELGAVWAAAALSAVAVLLLALGAFVAGRRHATAVHEVLGG